jgi:hypothetical protein
MAFAADFANTAFYTGGSMSRFVFCFGLVLGVVLSLSASSVAAQDKKADDKAKEIHGQFVKAIKAKDLDGMMKLVDVPWIGFSKEVIKDEKDLKKALKGFLDSIEDPAMVKADIKEILSYAKFREKFKDKKEALKLLDVLKLTNDDRVIVEASAAIIIRIRDGKAKVVGVLE